MNGGQEIILQKGFNCRDLGGYRTSTGRTILPHKLIRAGYLSDLSLTDQARLYTYGVRTIIDLRSPAERQQYPDRLDSRMRYLRLPILRQDRTQNVQQLIGRFTDKQAGKRQMLALYQQLVVTAEAQQAYRQFFSVLGQKSTGGLLFHCSGGKDRTGVLTILLLKVLGVPADVIRADYLASNQASAVRINQRLNKTKLVSSRVADLQSVFDLSVVRPAYLDQVETLIQTRYGGFPAYLANQIGVTTAETEQLKKRYLTTKGSSVEDLVL
ncbi:phosphatase [Levilactobacillus zymae]|uniref:Phosphatase n=1 Tax=Levilactobacillus zymae TaxID=267363 RepID=A0ABQ0WYE4_9LACO|nr:tyrosine-protein phosphatase [Levilactobacillus zymae]KRL16443.1 protein tyrosine serine phosphatase [Levilactobacillus zymae DSM 19395]QFR60543.1 protein-tyrosine-phosphatase [Levilactobacillus zymae]GEO72925.1 phosphatase [Levilactobacillus zymae]